MFWAIVLILALLIPILAIIVDSPLGRSWARRFDRAEGGGQDLAKLEEKVERLEDEVDTLTRSLEAMREEVQFLQRLLETRDAQPLKPPTHPPA